MELASQDDIRDFDADQRMRKLLTNLETLLKRHRPLDYATFAGGQLSAAFENPRKLAQIRPHHVLHSIEANCAYSRTQNRDIVDRNRLARVMNVYYEHQEPLHSGLLED